MLPIFVYVLLLQTVVANHTFTSPTHNTKLNLRGTNISTYQTHSNSSSTARALNTRVSLPRLLRACQAQRSRRSVTKTLTTDHKQASVLKATCSFVHAQAPDHAHTHINARTHTLTRSVRIPSTPRYYQPFSFVLLALVVRVCKP